MRRKILERLAKYTEKKEDKPLKKDELAKPMSFKDLIAEHQELVKTLKSNKPSDINKELKEQTEELDEYKTQYANLLKRMK